MDYKHAGFKRQRLVDARQNEDINELQTAVFGEGGTGRGIRFYDSLHTSVAGSSANSQWSRAVLGVGIDQGAGQDNRIGNAVKYRGFRYEYKFIWPHVTNTPEGSTTLIRDQFVVRLLVYRTDTTYSDWGATTILPANWFHGASLTTGVGSDGYKFLDTALKVKEEERFRIVDKTVFRPPREWYAYRDLMERPMVADPGCYGDTAGALAAGTGTIATVETACTPGAYYRRYFQNDFGDARGAESLHRHSSYNGTWKHRMNATMEYLDDSGTSYSSPGFWEMMHIPVQVYDVPYTTSVSQEAEVRRDAVDAGDIVLISKLTEFWHE